MFLDRLVTRARLLRQLGSDDWLIAAAMVSTYLGRWCRPWKRTLTNRQVVGVALVPLQEAISHAVRDMLEALFANGPPGMAPPSPEVLNFGARAGKLNYVAGVLYLAEIG